MVNLISNGDFASASGSPDLDPTGWTVSETAPDSVQVVGGVLHFNSGSGPNGGAISQTVTGAPIGDTVDFSFDYSEPGVGQGARHIHVTITDGNSNVVYDAEIDDSGSYSTSFTSTTNDYTVTFTDTSTGNPANDPIIDNVVFDVPFVVCFARGSLVHCDIGLVPVEDLRPGDMVQTQDHGLQPVRWRSGRSIDGRHRFAPVRIKAGVLGNVQDLLVSPHHKLLVSDWRAELLFGSREVLVAARDLVNDRDIRPDPVTIVEYHHFLFDRHELVQVNGCWSESFFPGDFALRALPDPSRNEMLAIFPELARRSDAYGPQARQCLRPREAALLH